MGREEHRLGDFEIRMLGSERERERERGGSNRRMKKI